MYRVQVVSDQLGGLGRCSLQRVVCRVSCRLAFTDWVTYSSMTLCPWCVGLDKTDNATYAMDVDGYLPIPS